MSDQILIDIDNLYKLYDYRNIKLYYQDVCMELDAEWQRVFF